MLRACGGREPVRGRCWSRPSHWIPVEKGEEAPRSDRQAQRPRWVLYPWVRAKSLQSCLTVQPHGLSPSRLLCLWDSPGKNSGTDHHTLLQEISLTQASNLHLTSPALEAGLLPLAPSWGRSLDFT